MVLGHCSHALVGQRPPSKLCNPHARGHVCVCLVCTQQSISMPITVADQQPRITPGTLNFLPLDLVIYRRKEKYGGDRGCNCVASNQQSSRLNGNERHC